MFALLEAPLEVFAFPRFKVVLWVFVCFFFWGFWILVFWVTSLICIFGRGLFLRFSGAGITFGELFFGSGILSALLRGSDGLRCSAPSIGSGSFLTTGDSLFIITFGTGSRCGSSRSAGGGACFNGIRFFGSFFVIKTSSSFISSSDSPSSLASFALFIWN